MLCFPGNVDGLFTIDRVSGDIRANGALDREKASAFQLKIKASQQMIHSLVFSFFRASFVTVSTAKDGVLHASYKILF